MMNKFICVCEMKINNSTNECIGFGFEKHKDIFILDEDSKNLFNSIISRVILFRDVVGHNFNEDIISDLEYFLNKATDGVISEIEIGEEYEDNYLNLSINPIESFFEKKDVYIGYVSGNFRNEEDVINYVLDPINRSGIFDKSDIVDGMVEFKSVANNLYLCKVGY